MKKFKKIINYIIKWAQKLHQKKFFFGKTQKNFVLKIRLSIRVRNFVPLNDPLNVKIIILYFGPKVAYL